MGLSDRRLPKNLRVRNGAFVSSAHIVVDKGCAATGSVGGGYFDSVVLQVTTSHWKKFVNRKREKIQKVTLIRLLDYTLRFGETV